MGKIGLMILSNPSRETGDSLRSSKESAVARKESAERLFEMNQKEIERLREEIEEKKSNIMRRLLEFRKIREMEARLGFVRKVGESHEKDAERMGKLIEYYDGLIVEEERFDALVGETYEGDDALDERKWQEMLEEEEKRNVANLAKEHGAFFVHDFITSDNRPSNVNHVVETDKLSMDEQVDIMVGLAPSISASTIHPETRERMFNDEFSKRGSGFGCFISGGRVQAGRPLDMGSVAVSLRERVAYRDDVHSTKNISDAISKTFDDAEGPRYRDENTSYNEFIIQNPEIAGVYFKWEAGNGMQGALEDNAVISLQNGSGVRYDGWWDSIGELQKKNLPIFVLDRSNNTTRLVYDIDGESRTFKVTLPFDPAMMVSLPGIYKQHTDKEERRKAVMRVFDKVSGVLTDEEKTFKPDGSEDRQTASPYRLYE